MGCGASKLEGDGQKPVKPGGGDVTGAATRHANHVSRAAVSLAWLQRFVEENQVLERGLTSSQLVSEVIKPATAGEQCRYTDWMLRDPDFRGAVSQGRPFYFVSHTWSRPFPETLNMIARHFEPERQLAWRRKDGQPLPPLAPDEVFVWFDMFAVNQHHHPGTDNGDLAALCEAVVDAQATLMVLDPYGTLLTRIWCLYEAWQGSRSGRDRLRLLSYGLKWELLEKVFIDLDVSSAQATVEADKIRILADIQQDVGSLDGMTHRLKDVLVAGTVAQVPPLGSEWTEDGDVELYTAARLCQLYGRLDEAEPLFRRALNSKERVLGPNHSETLTSVHNLAYLLQAQGKLEEAEPLLRRALAGQERELGPNHTETLGSVNNLAVLLQMQGKMEEADPLLRRALQGCEQQLGANHPETLTAVNNLAYALQVQGKTDEAEPLLRRALQGCERELGANHPDTLGSVNNLAGLLMSKGNFDEAGPLYRRALEGCERVLGASHPNTLAALNNLAGLLEAQGRPDEAEPLYRRALEGRQRVLGLSHCDTLDCAKNLAALLSRTDRRPGG